MTTDRDGARFKTTYSPDDDSITVERRATDRRVARFLRTAAATDHPTPPAPDPSPSAALVEALASEIHATYCERSAVAMRRWTPQVTAHQVEGLVLDRLPAIIAAARKEGPRE